VAIVVLAALLRLFPIWFGLPYPEARPDEETAIGKAIAILGGDFNPHFFHWPSLIFYLFAAVYGVASLIRRAVSLDPTLTTTEQFLLARGCVALAGTATVIVVHAMGRRIAGAVTGRIAALFLAVSILHVRDSHFAMADVVMTLLVTLSLALLLRAADGDTADGRAMLWYAAAGAAGGFAASTKYNAAAVVAAAGAAQILALARARSTWSNPRAWRPSLAFAGTFAAAFIVASPYALLDSATFVVDFRFDLAHLSRGHQGLDLGRGWTYHLLRSLPYGAGLTIFLAGLAGIVPMVRRHARHAAIVGAFVAALYGALGNGTTVFFRYILPLIPLVCLSGAVAVTHVTPWLAARTGLTHRLCLALLVIIVAGPAFVSSAWMDLLLAKTDTRVLAGRWLEEHMQPEDSLHDAGGSYTRLQIWNTRFRRWNFSTGTDSFGDPAGRTPDWLVLHQSPLSAYTISPPALQSLAATNYDLVHTARGTPGSPSRAVYDPQDAFFLPFSAFETVERPGPTILIYRRRDLLPLRQPP
jgi:hypothetical protein